MTPQQPTTNPPSTLRTVMETARQLALSRSSVYELIRTGALPHYRLGGAIRISSADIESYLAGCRRGPQPAQVSRPVRTRLRHIKL